MKIKIDLTAQDIAELNNPETEAQTMAFAHDLLSRMLEDRNDLIKCSMSIDGDK